MQGLAAADADLVHRSNSRLPLVDAGRAPNGATASAPGNARPAHRGPCLTPYQRAGTPNRGASGPAGSTWGEVSSRVIFSRCNNRQGRRARQWRDLHRAPLLFRLVLCGALVPSRGRLAPRVPLGAPPLEIGSERGFQPPQLFRRTVPIGLRRRLRSIGTRIAHRLTARF